MNKILIVLHFFAITTCAFASGGNFERGNTLISITMGFLSLLNIFFLIKNLYVFKNPR